MLRFDLTHPAWSLVYTPEAFATQDPRPDPEFYATDRFVSHLDETALGAVRRIIDALVVEPEPSILDLMASWDSHLPKGLNAREVVGLGLNPRELEANTRLTERVVHDLNADPHLPFEDGRFDVALCTVSVDYLTRPFEVFAEVARVLRPGGLFLVIFSNRMFPEKAVSVWRHSDEAERTYLVEDYFASAASFGRPEGFLVKGLPRPEQDRHTGQTTTSDPVVALWAETRGGSGPARPRPTIAGILGSEPGWKAPKGASEQLVHVHDTGCCPYCNQRLRKWEVPNTPFTEWDTSHLWVCFNDACSYLLSGWSEMGRQGNRSTSYRVAYHPESDVLMPLPVSSLRALKESIVD